MKLKKNVAKRAIISEAYGDCLPWYLINRIKRYMYFKPVPTGIDYLIKPARGGLNLETNFKCSLNLPYLKPNYPCDTDHSIMSDSVGRFGCTAHCKIAA